MNYTGRCITNKYFIRCGSDQAYWIKPLDIGVLVPGRLVRTPPKLKTESLIDNMNRICTESMLQSFVKNIFFSFLNEQEIMSRIMH